MKNIWHKLKRYIGVVSFGLLAISGANAQSSIDLRINEFLVYNDSNFVDDFGVHNPWIEIYNTAFNTVNIGGLYLTNDLSNPTMYYIPKGQPVTAIAPQSFLVFWADNHPTRGILHLNFDLRESKLIALFDASGKTLIDSITIPQNQAHDVTFGRLADGGTQWGSLLKATPGASNVTETGVSAAEQFRELDPTGVGMIAIAMSVVFSALAMLYLFFKYFGKSMVKGAARKQAKAESVTTTPVKPASGELSGEVNAAIVMALYLHKSQLHDHENTVLTINKVSRTYSPWSSKIYGLRKLPGQV